jgi:hypothetical protein
VENGFPAMLLLGFYCKLVAKISGIYLLKIKIYLCSNLFKKPVDNDATGF